jgi:protein OPY2
VAITKPGMPAQGTRSETDSRRDSRANTPPGVERAFRTMFKRCVQCGPSTPSCPSCGKGDICSLVPQSCESCAYATCIANPNATSSPQPNVGAIAGGVIGGVFAVAIVVFFVWRFWIKKKREQQEREMEMEAEEWEEDDIAQQKRMHQFNAMHSDAVSTRTRGSLANSILSRASNIIQIAYIPGVTNRNGSGHNSLLGNAPVPPIPAAMKGGQPPKSPLSNEGDALFFRPGDLRDSTWSASSSLRSGNRDTQYTRQSITPSLARSSVVSDIYRDDATEVPMPATTVTRVAPRMVSVKSSSSGSPSEDGKTVVSASEHAEFEANTPAGKGKGIQIMMPGQGSSPPGSVRLKPKQVTVGGSSNSKGRFPVRQASDASTLTATSKHAPPVSSPLAEIDNSNSDNELEEDEEEDGDDEHARARRSLLNALQESTKQTPLVQPAESPFFDASETLPAASGSSRPNPYKTMASTVGKDRSRQMGHLSDIIEEATKRASAAPEHEGLGGKRDESPFSDQHASGE